MKAGDIIMVHKKGPYKLKDIPAPVIRWLTGCYYNHVAIIGECLGELWVFEAIDKGFHPTHRLENYLKSPSREVAIMEPISARDVAWTYAIIGRMLGAKYDFTSLLWFQLWYQITGRWRGKIGREASKKLYCSEAIAAAFPDIFPEPWLISPADIWTSRGLVCVYESNKTDRILFDNKYSI